VLLLSLYVGALILGGGLLGASAILGAHGHDHDHDHDFGHHDADHGHDQDHDADQGHIGAAEALWMPILSLRFWTFFLAFFGLTGSLLDGLGRVGLVSGPWWVALVLALVLGLASGYAVSAIVRALKTKRVSSDVVPEVDYVGKVGEVLLDVSPGESGLVRLEVKGTSIDLPATVEAGAAKLARGEQVLVMAWERGRLAIQPYEEPRDAPPGERERGRERERA
jgi:membrane protein implicated in regulation of membrane protease activity